MKELKVLEGVGTNDTSKYKPNELVNKILDLKSSVESNAEKCKVIISTLAMLV